MANEMFTFVTLFHDGHRVEQTYSTRAEADAWFNKLIDLPPSEGALVIAYYCASVGGLVNCWRSPEQE
jgi:hypothetical protein